MADDFMTLGQLLGTSNKGAFEDDVPELRVGESHDCTMEGHHMRVTATSEVGCDSGRRRYRVECLTCPEVVHDATTGAYWNLERHLRDVAERATIAARLAIATAKDTKR